MLEQGVVPIHEPGLSTMISRNVSAGRQIQFGPSFVSNSSNIVFIAVGTPPNEDGSTEPTHVLTVAQQIGQLLTVPMVIVDKSTVPVGTADHVRSTIQAELHSADHP